jgi:hypothetical protein
MPKFDADHGAFGRPTYFHDHHYVVTSVTHSTSVMCGYQYIVPMGLNQRGIVCGIQTMVERFIHKMTFHGLILTYLYINNSIFSLKYNIVVTFHFGLCISQKKYELQIQFHQ